MKGTPRFYYQNDFFGSNDSHMNYRLQHLYGEYAGFLTGFTFGVAINVASGELFKITGTEKSGSNTWEKLWEWLTSLDDANRATVVVGVLALVLVFGIKL